MVRPSLAELITAKLLVPKVVPGGPKFGWFRRSKNSARNCRFALSKKRVFLMTEKSKLTRPGARTSERVRATLPNVNAGGWEKTLGSKYRVKRLSTEPESLAPAPLLFGREPPPRELVWLFEV